MSGDSGLHTVEGFIWHNEDSEYACIQSLLRSCDRGTNPNLRRLSSTNLSQTHSAITEGKKKNIHAHKTCLFIMWHVIYDILCHWEIFRASWKKEGQTGLEQHEVERIDSFKEKQMIPSPSVTFGDGKSVRSLFPTTKEQIISRQNCFRGPTILVENKKLMFLIFLHH